MATSGKMTLLFSNALGLTQAHVAARYRALREGGRVTKGGRGRFAPDMTPLDAARLLIAVMGAEAIGDTVAAVQIFGGSDCVVDDGEDDPLGEAIRQLVFEDAIALIFQACLAWRLGDRSPYERLARGVTIELSPSSLTAVIRRDGFSALFQPNVITRLTDASLSEEMSPGDRMQLRADRQGLDVRVSVDTTDLLELAPALGCADDAYRPTH